MSSRHHRRILGGAALRVLTNGAFDSGITRAPSNGVFLAVRDLNFSAFGTSTYLALYDDADDSVEHGLNIKTGGVVDIVENGATVAASIVTLSTGVNYDIFIVLDANKNAHYLLRSGTGDYERLWVGTYASAVSLIYGESANTGATFIVAEEYFGIGLDIGSPAIEISSPSVGALSDLPDADVVISFTITAVPSASQIDLAFRQQDATHEWINRITNAGTISLQEDFAGLTQRANTTPPITNGMRIVLRVRGNIISARYNGTQAWSYSSSFNYLRELGFQLNSLGTAGVISNLRVWKAYLRDESGLGSELSVNGTFASGTGWTLGTGWSIGGGTGNCDGSQVSVSTLRQTNPNLTLNRYYQLNFDVSNYSAGSLTPRFSGSDNLPPIIANGNYTYLGVTINPAVLYVLFQADADFIGSIDNISVKEILFTPDATALVLNGVLV